MFWWYNLESDVASLIIVLVTVLSVVHVVTAFSMLGRLITNSSAMAETPIMPKEQEEKLTPKEISDILLAEAEIHRRLRIPINKQYLANMHVAGSSPSYATSLIRRHPGIRIDGYDNASDVVESDAMVFESLGRGAIDSKSSY